MEDLQKTKYQESALKFLRERYDEDTLYFFTTIMLMNQLLKGKDRKALEEKVRNISDKMQTEFEEDILMPLVSEGIVEKAIVCSQSWSPERCRWIEVNEQQYKMQRVYRLCTQEPSRSYDRYLARLSLDSSML